MEIKVSSKLNNSLSSKKFVQTNNLFDDEYYTTKHNGMICFERGNRKGNHKSYRYHRSFIYHIEKVQTAKKKRKDNVEYLYALSSEC